jgi:hypothetical protein
MMQPLRPTAMALLLSIASFGALVHAHDHNGGESHIPEGEAISFDPIVSRPKRMLIIQNSEKKSDEINANYRTISSGSTS